MRKITTKLLQYSGEDYEIWKSQEHGITFYHIGIEGYVGFENFEDAISEYEEFLNQLHNYLKSEGYPKAEMHGWKRLYKTRAVEVCYEFDCYWIFLEQYKSTEIWFLYYYLEDVINQLKGIKDDIKIIKE